MPLLTLFPSSTATIPADPQTLLRELSSALAAVTGKSESWVMTRLETPRPMTFAGSDEPCCYAECKSIGLNAELATRASAELTAVIARGLSVPAARIYIEFGSPSGELWGFNGETF